MVSTRQSYYQRGAPRAASLHRDGGLVNADTLPQSQGDRLALLYRVSQTFNSSLDLDTVLNRVMDEVIAVTHAVRGFVLLLDEEW